MTTPSGIDKDYIGDFPDASADDISSVLLLIDKYSAQLREICVDMETFQERRRRLLFMIIGSCIVAFSFAFALIYALRIDPDFVAIGVAFFIGYVVSGYMLLSTRRRSERYRSEEEYIASTLKRLVVFVTHLHQQQKLDFTERLEVELRLAEADSISRRYEFLSK